MIGAPLPGWNTGSLGFHVDADSIVGRARTMAKDKRASNWIPVVMLVWTFWIFATPLFETKQQLAQWLPATLVTFVIFLFLYFRAYCRSTRSILWYALGIAALAFILTPINPGAQGYLIYACAFLAFSGSSMRAALRNMLIVCGLYALECVYLAVPIPYIWGAALFGLCIGLMNVLYRRNQEQNHDLKLSYDEVRRLATMAERERIGRDLHDLLGHTLSLVALKSELARKLFDRDPEAAQREMQEVERVARDALAQVRRAVTGIRAAGLAAELASARLLLESSGVSFDYARPPDGLPADVETCLALVLREAVTNVQRHARARRAFVSITMGDTHATLHVEDDGRGGALIPGNGLSGMRERVEGCAGHLSVDSTAGGGTRLRATVPLPKPPAIETGVHPQPQHSIAH